MDSLEVIKDTAAQWLAKREREDWSAADQAEFDAWLGASTSNNIAYLRAEMMWKRADRLKVLGASAASGQVPALSDWQASSFFRRTSKVGAAPKAPVSEFRFIRGVFSPRRALAAGIVLAAGPGLYVLAGNAFRGGDAYSTSIGVTAAVPMSDGSRITLNTDSEVRVSVSATERRVNLSQGEAFFEVAQDPSRPFVVQAGDKRIIAVGTQFSVRRDQHEIRVVVTEGKVRVEEIGGGKRSTQLSAGAIARTGNVRVAVQEKPLTEVAELLSWRSGFVVFHETPLAEVVTEFNRYNTQKLVIQDPLVAGIQISGNFRATNIESFTRALEDGFPVSVQRRGERILLMRQ